MTSLEGTANCTIATSLTQGYKEGVESGLLGVAWDQMAAKKLMRICNLRNANKLMALASQQALLGAPIIAMRIPVITVPPPNVTSYDVISMTCTQDLAPLRFSAPRKHSSLLKHIQIS